MDDTAEAVNGAEDAARRGGAIVGTLADRIGGRAGVQAIFGEPIERDGVTVIPVGSIRWGFGGGAGKGGEDSDDGEGSGGGGGAIAAPVGYIEIAGGTAGFRRIGPSMSPGLLLAAGFALMVTLRALRAFIR